MKRILFFAVLASLFCSMFVFAAEITKKDKKKPLQNTPSTPPTMVTGVPPASGIQSESLSAPPMITNFFKPSMDYADTNKDAMFSPEELKVYDEGKLKIFDLNQDGKLDDKETKAFQMIDEKFAKGGEGVDQLSDPDKQLYRKWRDFIYSLALETEKKARGPGSPTDQSGQPTKCYPDKVCDDPSSPFYKTTEGHKERHKDMPVEGGKTSSK